MVRTRRQRTVVEQDVAGHSEWDVRAACGHAIPARRDADDRSLMPALQWPWGWLRQIVGDHCGPGDLRCPAVQPDAGAGGFEAGHALCPKRRDHSCKDIAGTGTRQPSGAGGAKPSRPSGEATSVSGPL